MFFSFTALAGFFGVQLMGSAPHAAPPPPVQAQARIKPRQAVKVVKPELPSGYNYALARNGAMAIGGRDPALLIDGDDTHYTGGTGFAMTQWNAEPPQSFLITLKSPVSIDCIRFLLWDRSEERYYRYKLETCADDKAQTWSMAADRSGPAEQGRSWQTVRFTPRIVHLIRLTGTFNSGNNGFHVVELQASLGLPANAEPPANDALDF